MYNTKTERVYTIYFDEIMGVVIMEWNGYANSKQFREGTELMLQELIEHNASKVLADIKNMILIGAEDQKWLGEFFLPNALNSGFKAIAIIKPDNYFNRVAIENISNKVNKKKLNIDFFEDIDEAKNWLNKL